MTDYAVELRNVTKTFGSVVANRDVSLGIRKGEILALLGENGSGKTTLMNMISGIYHPDSGKILLDGKEVKIHSPKDALSLGIGMIHQHFKLVDIYTAAENLALGAEGGAVYHEARVTEKLKEICDRYGFSVNPKKKVYAMSVSEKQTLEIVKVLYRGANVLILDEPTAVLTPQETAKLFEVIRNMKKAGKSVIIITHKLNEVLEISDRVAILRKGEYVDTVNTSETSVEQLTELMVGERVELNLERPEVTDLDRRLTVEHLTVYHNDGTTALDDVSFDLFGGEILGIAGISGCGQKELLEAIAGLQECAHGTKITYENPGTGKSEELIGKSPRTIRKMGITLSFVPEDRLGMGLVGSMGMVDNMMLKDYREHGFLFANRKYPKELAESILEELQVVTPSVNTPVRRLSGGNVQKVLVGREIAAAPSVLLTAYAVRGLDINTSYAIYHLLNEQKQKGVAVVYVGEDLDVLLGLSDRILVLSSGRVAGILDGRTATKEEVGRLMTQAPEVGEEIPRYTYDTTKTFRAEQNRDLNAEAEQKDLNAESEQMQDQSAEAEGSAAKEGQDQ